MERVGAFSFCQGQSKQNSTSFFLQLKESINRRLNFWPEKEPSAAEIWPVVFALRIMRITEVPLKSALRTGHLWPCYKTGMQEQPGLGAWGRRAGFPHRSQHYSLVLLDGWTSVLFHHNTRLSLSCPEPLQQKQAGGCSGISPRALLGAWDQERCSGRRERGSTPHKRSPQKDPIPVTCCIHTWILAHHCNE